MPRLTRPSQAAAPPDKWRAQQKDLPNQVYSTAGTRVSYAGFCAWPAAAASGSATIPRSAISSAPTPTCCATRVAQFWKTTDIRANNAPMVGVTFMLRRDGSVTGIRITQKSGISALDISAQRAIMDAAPFPPVAAAVPQERGGD